MTDFHMRLNEHREKLLDKIKEKIGYSAHSKNVERALELFLAYRKFIKERFYSKLEKIKKEVPLK